VPVLHLRRVRAPQLLRGIIRIASTTCMR